MPPVRMRGDGRMAKDPKKTLGRLLNYLKAHWIVLLIVGLFALILATRKDAYDKLVKRVKKAAKREARARKKVERRNIRNAKRIEKQRAQGKIITRTTKREDY